MAQMTLFDVTWGAVDVDSYGSPPWRGALSVMTAIV